MPTIIIIALLGIALVFIGAIYTCVLIYRKKSGKKVVEPISVKQEEKVNKEPSTYEKCAEAQNRIKKLIKKDKDVLDNLYKIRLRLHELSKSFTENNSALATVLLANTTEYENALNQRLKDYHATLVDLDVIIKDILEKTELQSIVRSLSQLDMRVNVEQQELVDELETLNHYTKLVSEWETSKLYDNILELHNSLNV
jgi:hypothetical protein